MGPVDTVQIDEGPQEDAATPPKFCITELSSMALVASVLSLSGVLWLAIAAVI